MATNANARTQQHEIPYSRAELRDPAVPGYTGEALRMISFPLGGIGTGTIGLGEHDAHHPVLG